MLSSVRFTYEFIIFSNVSGSTASLYFSTSITFIFPSVIVPVLSKHKVSMCAKVSTLYKSCTKTCFLASFITPVSSDILVSNTKPFGSIPKSAAAVAITDCCKSTSLNIYAWTNKITPAGIITKLVKFVTFFIEFKSSEFTFLCFLVAFIIWFAKLSSPTFSIFA